MASRIARFAFECKSSRSRFSLSSSNWVCSSCRRHAYSTTTSETPAPSVLLKLRNDLKTAMRNKDTNRLNVLRALLAEVTNSAKTSTPIKTDMQLLSLLRKRQAAARKASEEFKSAGREDLVEKEAAQVNVLEEYAAGVEVMPLEDVREAIKATVEELRAQDSNLKAGPVMKSLFSTGGRLDGRNVEKSTVPGILKELLGSS